MPPFFMRDEENNIYLLVLEILSLDALIIYKVVGYWFANRYLRS